MAIIGISLIVASVVLFCLRPPAWLPLRKLVASLGRQTPTTVDHELDPRKQATLLKLDAPLSDAAEAHGDDDGDGQATPKAGPSTPDMKRSVPSFSLSEPLPSGPADQSATPSAATSLPPATTSKPSAASNLMPPPPPPPRALASSSKTGPPPSAMAPPPVPLPQARRMPTLAPAARNSSSLRASPATSPNRSLPVPSRAPGTSTLAPPPSHSSIPTKPSRQVKLTPGHSPMDWARFAQSPTSDLRGLPPSTPYLRVTPSQLRQMTGRKGKDAWSVFSGKVYNISPYISFHPGGEAELLRAAGRDGTRMFAEVHPWVNYETMLSACLIGILVDEHEVEQRVGKAMEELD
ncbi:hypothetical protein DHEL01_v211198 [Diaporthe helianthi]|uniref:Cytochrome b5 heme-binding domain-containing protein n=1 Tax=Diaporthe helianthi TaxID=158607 RepID=A0A2P5HJH1_DIAHE|nr:hypothetical protein DHEL01_v211198 [Diaporthe helianthi]